MAIPAENTLPLLSKADTSQTEELMPSLGLANETILTGPRLDERAFQYAMLTGDDLEKVKSDLTRGDESKYKERLVNMEMAKRAQASRDLVIDNVMAGPLPPDHPIMHDLTDTGLPPDPETVTEDVYSKKIMDLLLSADTTEATMKAFEDNPMGFGEKLKPYEEYIQKQLIIEKYRRQNEELLAQRGIVPATVDFVVSALGIPSWLQFTNQTGSESWTTTGSMRDQIERLYSMPPAEMDKALREMLPNLQTFNPNDAQQFLEALQTYSQGSGEADYIMDVLNIPGIAIAKRLGRAAKKAVIGGKTLKTAIKDGAELGARELAKEAPEAAIKGAEKKIEDVTRAAVSRGTTVPSALSGSGAVDTAVEYALKDEWINTVFKDGALASKKQFSQFLDRIPDFWSLKVKANKGDSFYGKVVEPIIDRAEYFYRKIGDAIATPALDRVPIEVLQGLMEQAKKDVTQYLPKTTNDAILNFRKILPEESPLNIPQLEVHLGTRDGKLFDSATDAVRQAKHYGMHVGDYAIDAVGDKYVLKTHIDIDETGGASKILTPENQAPNSVFNFLRFLGSSKSQNSNFQNANRQLAVQGSERLKGLFEDLYKPYGLLTKKEKKSFDSVMEYLRDREAVPGNPNTKGTFFKDTAELESTWMRIHGRLPSDKEKAAYEAVRKAHDVDLIFRSMNLMAQKSSMGIRTFSLPTFTKAGEFANIEAKFVSLPNAGHDISGNLKVLVEGVDEAGRSKWFVEKLSDYFGRDFQFKALQFYDPRDAKLMKLTKTKEPIAYALVRNNPVSHPLRFDKQIPIRQGLHTEYKSEWYVKQPRVVEGRYDGDTTALGFRTEAEATRFGAAFEKARILYNEGKTAELVDHVRKELPLEFLDLKKWDSLFNEHLDKNIPFAVVPKDTKVGISGKRMLNGKYFHEHFEGVDTTLDQFHNLSNKFGDPYIANRDPDVLSITGGTEGNPLIKLGTAEKLAPMLSETRAVSKLINSRFYNDYQISAATSWIQTFKHLLTVDGKPITEEQLQRNPLYYLDRAELTKAADPKVKVQATYLRNNIKQLLGTPSKTTQALEYYKQKLLSSVYENYGEKGLEYVPEALIPTIRHPEQFFRSVASHMKLGLFNVTQLFVQGSAVTNVVAIHPVHGLQSAPASAIMRMLSLTEDPKIIAKGGEFASHFPGWTKEKFVESHKLMSSINFDKVGGENAYSNVLQDPSLYNSMSKTFLDKGFMFFNEGERAVRLTSWNTSYLKWAKENPEKVGKATRQDLREIAQHAQTLAGNMTRDTNAIWQTGWTGNAFQWQAYNLKLAELMVGRQLTIAQRGRLMLGQNLLWGSAPTAAVVYAIENGDPNAILDTVTGGDLEVYAANNGIDISKDTVGAIYRGLVSVAYEGITGERLDFASRYGMSSPTRLLETWQKNFKENNALLASIITAMGPSGNVLHDIVKSSAPILGDIANLFHGDPEYAKTMLPADIANGLREISSVNLYTKLSAIWQGQAYFSKAGNLTADYEGEENPFIASINALVGAPTSDESFAYHIVDFNKDQKEVSQALKDRAKILAAEWRKALRTGDKAAIDKAYNTLFVYVTATKLTDGEKMNILFSTEDTTIIEKIFKDWMSEKKPESLLREKALNDRKGE